MWHLWVRPISIGSREATTGLVVVWNMIVVTLVEVALTIVGIEGRSGGRVVE